MGSHVLIIDAITLSHVPLKAQLMQASYRTSCASSGKEGLKLCRELRPGAVIVSSGLPDISLAGFMAQVQADPTIEGTPVIALCAEGDVTQRQRALRSGCDDAFCKPFDDQLLLARLRNLMRNHNDLGESRVRETELLLGLAETQDSFDPRCKIALITERAAQAQRFRLSLASFLSSDLHCLPPSDALGFAAADSRATDLYIIDADGCQPDLCLRLISELRSRPSSASAGICWLGDPLRGAVLPEIALDLGANGLIDCSMGYEEISLRLQSILRRKQKADRLKSRVQDSLRLAAFDPLTGLHNRRYAMARMQEIAAASPAETGGFAVMVADIDRFKAINDSHGHAIGDQVLQEIAKRLGAHLRDGDLLARIGGEEFLIALPNTELDAANAIAQKICGSVRDSLFCKDGVPISVTVSIGLAHSSGVIASTGPLPAQHIPQLIALADDALLRAKKHGRDMVTLQRSAA